MEKDISSSNNFKKEVQIKGKSKDLNLIVFNLLKEGKQPIDMLSILGMKKMSNLSYYLTRLRKSGSIRKIGYGTWEAIEYKKKEVQKIDMGKVGHSKPFIIPFNKKIRGHAYQLVLEIPKIANWLKREEFLKKRRIPYETINKGYTQRIKIKNHTIWLNKKTIVVWIPKDMSYYAKDSFEAESLAISDILDIIGKIESRFKISLKINKKYKYRIARRHTSYLKDGMAIEMDYKKQKVRVTLKNGVFEIDNSFQLHEAELQGNKANEYMEDAYRPFVKSFFDFYESAGEPFTINHFNKLSEVVSQLTMRNFDMQTTNKQTSDILQDIAKRIIEIEKFIKYKDK